MHCNGPCLYMFFKALILAPVTWDIHAGVEFGCIHCWLSAEAFRVPIIIIICHFWSWKHFQIIIAFVECQISCSYNAFPMRFCVIKILKFAFLSMGQSPSDILIPSIKKLTCRQAGMFSQKHGVFTNVWSFSGCWDTSAWRHVECSWQEWPDFFQFFLTL